MTACGYVDRYEAAVYDLDPRYCYRTLVGVECHDQPYHRYAENLVNYQGPHPSRYDAPEKVEVPELKAPAPVNYWVKDVEPIPRPSPVGYRAGSLPWLEQPVRPSLLSGEEQVSATEAPVEFMTAAESPAGNLIQAAPSVPNVRDKPIVRAPLQRTKVPLANPNQVYIVNSGG